MEKNALLDNERIELTSSNPELAKLYETISAFAMSDSSILIQGQSGTGKEIMAQQIHLRSSRRDCPFVAVNCAAIPDSLFEAELFGVAKGAATGTVARKGRVEMAAGGTLFLDEIGDLSAAAQAKLLRVLQDRTVTRVGSEEAPVAVDFRLVAATNRDLAQMVRDGQFREDLYYRIDVIRFRLPSLQHRADDIPEIANNILELLARKRGCKRKSMSDGFVTRLKAYSWPGNIRELQNKLERAVILSAERSTLGIEDLDLPSEAPAGRNSPALPGCKSLQADSGDDLNLRNHRDRLERELIQRALQRTSGNKTAAAELLGLTREGLRKAMMKFGATAAADPALRAG